MVTTKGGDGGQSGLLSGARRYKDDILFDTLGDIDELNSFLGYARSGLEMSPLRPWDNENCAATILQVQSILFRIGALTASADTLSDSIRAKQISDGEIDELEQAEKRILDSFSLSPGFVVPGFCEESARLDLSRAVCRRLERKLVHCLRVLKMEHLEKSQKMINRLSDVLFIMGRYWDSLAMNEKNTENDCK